MGYVKKVKSPQYFKRYQTKFRRRRECKTDYYARKRMILQDVNKLGCHKYRLVARFTSARCVAQIVYSTLEGDRILCHADSFELKRFGLTTGFANYASSYATGLLLARRLLQQLNLDTMYQGNANIDGKDYDVAALGETYRQSKRPFKAILDIGLIRSTVGNRAYAVLKGACDGGIHVPHNTRNFFGASVEKEETKRTFSYNPEAHRDRIFGCHIDEYMTYLSEKDQAKRVSHFTNWDKCLKTNGVATVEDLYTKIHAAIKANPKRVAKKDRKTTPQTYEDAAKTIIVTAKGKYKRDRKLTLEQRKANVQKKIEVFTSMQE